MSTHPLKHWAAILGALATLAGALGAAYQTYRGLRARDDLAYTALSERLIRAEAELDVLRDVLIARPESLATSTRPALPPRASEGEDEDAAHGAGDAPTRPRAPAPRAPGGAAPAPPALMPTPATPRIAPIEHDPAPSIESRLRAAVRERRLAAPASVDALESL